MKPTILLINFKDQQKLRKLKMALLPFKIRLKTVESQDYCQPIGYLAGFICILLQTLGYYRLVYVGF